MQTQPEPALWAMNKTQIIKYALQLHKEIEALRRSKMMLLEKLAKLEQPTLLEDA